MSKTKALYEYKIQYNEHNIDNLNIEFTEDFVYIGYYDDYLGIWNNSRIPIQIWNSITHKLRIKTWDNAINIMKERYKDW